MKRLLTFLCFLQIHAAPFDDEMLVHLPLLAHGHARQVLLLGSDEALPEILRHREVESSKVIATECLSFLRNEADRRYDIILCSRADLSGPEFYKECQRVLRSDGILVTQHSLTHDGIAQIYRDRAPFFQENRFYLAASSLFGWASNDRSYYKVGKKLLINRLKQNVEGALQYYTPSIHRAAFSLPAYLENALKDAAPKKRK